MSSEESVFVADTAFLDPAVIAARRLISVFPRVRGDGAFRDTADGLLRRSQLLSSYFDEVAPRLYPLFRPSMPAAGTAIGYFVRPVLVTIATVFLDRAVRVLHRRRQSAGGRAATVDPITTMPWLRSIGHSWHINQDLVQRIAAALGTSPGPRFAPNEYLEYPQDDRQPNLSFRPHPSGLLAPGAKLLAKGISLAARIPNPRARFVSKGLGYDDYYAARRGAYGPLGWLRAEANKPRLEAGTKDLGLRRTLSTTTGAVLRDSFSELFRQQASYATLDEAEQLGCAFANLFIEWFPTSFLEALSVNLKTVGATLQGSQVAGIVGAELSSDVGHFECATARLAGKVVIGVQEGGRYGYLEDLAVVGQTQYPLFDKLITWGWTRIDDHLPQCETLPLPCPKFSERPLAGNYAVTAARGGSGARDILFMSSLFNRFPHVSTSGVPRADFLDETTDAQEGLIRALHERGFTVDHKPYAMRFVDLYPEHYSRLAAAGGGSYRLIRSRQKGLTEALIKSCRLLVWDQIGTGTLECFTANIPSLVFWPRIYARETSWARPLIKALEVAGVVHTDAAALADEAQRYLSDPVRWMSDAPRCQAIQDFCDQFARVDSQWHRTWKRALLGGVANRDPFPSHSKQAQL